MQPEVSRSWPIYYRFCLQILAEAAASHLRCPTFMHILQCHARSWGQATSHPCQVSKPLSTSTFVPGTPHCCCRTPRLARPAWSCAAPTGARAPRRTSWNVEKSEESSVEKSDSRSGAMNPVLNTTETPSDIDSALFLALVCVLVQHCYIAQPGNDVELQLSAILMLLLGSRLPV